MPRVRPFFAIKCNPHSGVVRAMAALGCGFDCASAPEMQAALAAGATPADMILAHPCKRPVDLRFAANSNVLVRSPYSPQPLLADDHLWNAFVGSASPESGQKHCDDTGAWFAENDSGLRGRAGQDR